MVRNLLALFVMSTTILFYGCKSMHSDLPEKSTPDIPKEVKSNIKEASEASESWLKDLMDSGKYKEAWDTASVDFKKNVPAAKWQKEISRNKKALGKLLSRKKAAAQFAEKVTNMPEGKYVFIHYKSKFEKQSSIIETVVLAQDTDKRWKILSYYCMPESK